MKTPLRFVRNLVVTAERYLPKLAGCLVVLALAACGGGGGGGSPSPTPVASFTIGGTLSGLTGTVVLQNNGGNNLSLTADGSFTFSTALANGTAYSSTVLTQPAGQTCRVTNGSGTVSNANVTGVTVNCTTAIVSYTIGGTLSGLAGMVVLADNGGNNLSLTANGSFTFSTALASGAAYAATVLTQPAGQTCTVTNGSGTVSNANVTGVTVNCTNSSGYFTVSGIVTAGLTTGQLSSLVLSDGTTTTSPTACSGLCTGSNPFLFSPLPTGAPYSVSVVTQPSGETCGVTQGATGTVGTSNVTNVVISCLAGSWTSLSTMPVPRGHMAVAVLNNLIYTIGGDSNDNSQTKTCYNTVSVYDPSANAWSFAAPYPITGFGMGAVTINGKIYVFGGTDCQNNSKSVSSVYEYDPVANSWTAVSTMPYGGGALTNVGVGTDGTYAYVFGGINAASVTYSQSIQVYDPSANTWTSPSFTAPPMAGAAVVWDSNGSGGGVFLIIPGYGPSGPLSTGYQYFPGSNAGFQYSFPFATDFPAAAEVGSTIYVAVANNSSIPQFYQLPQTQLAPPTVQRSGASAAVVSGVFYLIGGFQPSGDNPGTGAVESFQP